METKKYIIILVLAMSLISRKSLFVSKQRYLLKAKKYQNECVIKMQSSNEDTIKFNLNRICLIDKNENFSFGKIKKGKKIGMWYFYKKEDTIYKCYLIQKKIKNDSIIIYSSSLVNYRKW